MKKLTLLAPFALLTACGGTQPTPPYDATGNWSITVTLSDSTNGTRTVTTPALLAITMTNKINGDFKGNYPVSNVSSNVMNGSTATGTFTFAAFSTIDGTIHEVSCKGAFNATDNTYKGICDPITAADKTIWDAQSVKMSIIMNRQ